MDTNLARRITALVEEIDGLEYGILEYDYSLDDVNPPEVISRYVQRQRKAKTELDALLVTAQRQELIERAKAVTLESYRR